MFFYLVLSGRFKGQCIFYADAVGLLFNLPVLIVLGFFPPKLNKYIIKCFYSHALLVRPFYGVLLRGYH